VELTYLLDDKDAVQTEIQSKAVWREKFRENKAEY